MNEYSLSVERIRENGDILPNNYLRVTGGDVDNRVFMGQLTGRHELASALRRMADQIEGRK